MGQPKIITEITPTPHNVHPEYSLMSEEWSSVRNNPQEIPIFCTFEGPHMTRGAPCNARFPGTYVTVSHDSQNKQRLMFTIPVGIWVQCTNLYFFSQSQPTLFFVFIIELPSSWVLIYVLNILD
jgi:hypothetical protein